MKKINRNKKAINFFTIFLILTALAVIYSLTVISQQKVKTKASLPSSLNDNSSQTNPNLSLYKTRLYQKYPNIDRWQRPLGPLKVALQIGHYKNEELPDEFENLRGSSLGTNGGGKSEVEVSLKIAEETAEILRQKGIEVDILPATIPEGYWADVFVAIHADGNLNYNVRGFKASGPWRDLTGESEKLVNIFYQEYGNKTGLPTDSNITPQMRGYYAFNWLRYNHSLHPMTTAIIIETGFLTNYADQKILIHQSSLASEGLANSILKFLKSKSAKIVFNNSLSAKTPPLKEN